MQSIGKSHEGRDIWLVTVTNKSTWPTSGSSSLLVAAESQAHCPLHNTGRRFLAKQHLQCRMLALNAQERRAELVQAEATSSLTK